MSEDPQYEPTEIGRAALAAAEEAGATELPCVSRDYTHATSEELGREIEALSYMVETLQGQLMAVTKELFETGKQVANIIDHISRTRVLPQEAGEKEI